MTNVGEAPLVSVVLPTRGRPELVRLSDELLTLERDAAKSIRPVA